MTHRAALDAGSHVPGILTRIVPGVQSEVDNDLLEIVGRSAGPAGTICRGSIGALNFETSAPGLRAFHGLAESEGIPFGQCL